MNNRNRLDFVLIEDNYQKTVFRFYPRKSHCHSFDENLPKSWEDVYKVYYSYSIIRNWKASKKKEILFECLCDECSVIDEVAETIRLVLSGQKVFEIEREEEKIRIKLLDRSIRPFGYGVTWLLHKEHKLFELLLWNYNNKGYCIRLDKEKLKEFGIYLNNCCEYMLQHGEPI